MYCLFYNRFQQNDYIRHVGKQPLCGCWFSLRMLKLGSCDKSLSWILIRVWTCSDQSKSILSGEFWQNGIQKIRNKMASAYVSILCLQGERICSVGPQIIFLCSRRAEVPVSTKRKKGRMEKNGKFANGWNTVPNHAERSWRVFTLSHLCPRGHIHTSTRHLTTPQTGVRHFKTFYTAYYTLL